MHTYKQGWNDYIDGYPYDYIKTTYQWREGWIDCRNAHKETNRMPTRR